MKEQTVIFTVKKPERTKQENTANVLVGAEMSVIPVMSATMGKNIAMSAGNYQTKNSFSGEK
jgi:hypothetical protein